VTVTFIIVVKLGFYDLFLLCAFDLITFTKVDILISVGLSFFLCQLQGLLNK